MMHDPTMPGQPSEQPNQEIIQRLERRIESEPNLYFLEPLFAELPELELYLVGGMVRDTIIRHKTAKDYDFVTRGVPFERLISVLKKFGDVTFNGKNFGVIDFWPNAEHIDEDKRLKQSIQIAFPRKEFSDGTGGYRDVKTLSDENMPLEDDLSRRDLTINAIAYNIRTHELIDPYGGQADLKKNIIRTVGDPEKRFQEDYTRILRAIRFACRFDAQIDPATWQAIQNLMPHLNDQREVKITDQLQRKLDMSTTDSEKLEMKKRISAQLKKNPDEMVMEFVISREKIGEEILKSFKEDPLRALDLLDESGALQLLLPEVTRLKGCEQPPVFHSEGDVFVHTRRMLSLIDSPEFKSFFPDYKPTGAFAFAVLFHDIGKPDTQKMPGHIREHITFHGHDIRGAEIVNSLKDRLKLDNQTFKMLTFLTREHMFLMSGDISQINANKIAQRFIDNPYGEELLMLFYLDCVGTVLPDGTSPLEKFHTVIKRILEIKQFRDRQPNKIISGSTIREILGVESSDKETLFLIGAANNLLKEFSNRGKINNEEEAAAFLTAHRAQLAIYRDQIIAEKETTDTQLDIIKKKYLSRRDPQSGKKESGKSPARRAEEALVTDRSKQNQEKIFQELVQSVL